ncbi:M20/M25/M40 family metallo-hydrolase [Candidatus Microgenomates bacterium]|nr:M20/M25/M40 family metallo-hydrolase [Candidatus Microgenomates bacterium]
MRELPSRINDPQDVTTLTRRLVQIPSYVNEYDHKHGLPIPTEQRVNESGIATYIADFLREHTNLTVRTQPVVDGRFNVIASNSDKPRLVLIGHTDTVKPSEGSVYDQLTAEVHNGKIYGLGAADMKSGLASIMSAAALYKDVPDVMLAFYVDEEYDFAGMRALIKDLPRDMNPELILSGDGGDLELGNGCRGLIEIHGTIRGKSAHAARPHLGVNAINGAVETFRSLQEQLVQFSHESLGNCTVNLASLDVVKAGQNRNGETIVVDQVNAVPDIAKFKVDIRTSSTEVRSQLVVADMLSFCKTNGLVIDGLKIQHDLSAWYTEKSELNQLSKIVEDITGNPVKFGDPTTGGYIDMQMLWDHVGRPPAAMIGPGSNAIMHQADEYVVIDDLLKSRDIFAQTINSFNSRRTTKTR